MGNFKNPVKRKWLFVCFRRKKSLKPNTTIEINDDEKIPITFSNNNNKKKKKIDSCPDDDVDGNSCRKSPSWSSSSSSRKFRSIFNISNNSAASVSPKKKENRGSRKEASNNHNYHHNHRQNSVSRKFEKIFNNWREKKSKLLISAAESLSQSSILSSLGWNSSRSSFSSTSSSRKQKINSSRNSYSSTKKQSTPSSSSSFTGKTIGNIPNSKNEKQMEEKIGKCRSKMEIGIYVMAVICFAGLIFCRETVGIPPFPCTLLNKVDIYISISWQKSVQVATPCTLMCLILFYFFHGRIPFKENGGINNGNRKFVALELEGIKPAGRNIAPKP